VLGAGIVERSSHRLAESDIGFYVFSVKALYDNIGRLSTKMCTANTADRYGRGSRQSQTARGGVKTATPAECWAETRVRSWPIIDQKMRMEKVRELMNDGVTVFYPGLA